MQKNFGNFNDEQVKAENDFLKMKLMLESDAYFDVGGSAGMPAKLENHFLKNIIEFEKQFANKRTISVFDKIGKPGHFKPVAEIPDDQVDIAWKRLDEFLHLHGVDLDVCSPNIKPRELYRFATEELFKHEIDDINVPGIIHGFIYDEFYPDHIYDNTRHAVQDCMSHILCKEPIEWFYCFNEGDIRLNEWYPLSIDQVRDMVNRFKASYDNIQIKALVSNKCIIEGEDCVAGGEYAVIAMKDSIEYLLSGKWEVYFKLDKQAGYWNVCGVRIEGVVFE